MNTIRICIAATLLLSFIVTTTPPALSTIITLDTELSPDSLEKILPHEKILAQKYDLILIALAQENFTEAQKRIEQLKTLALKYNLLIPPDLPEIEHICAVGRMNQIEMPIAFAYHDNNQTDVRFYAREALLLAKYHKIRIPLSIQRIIIKMQNDTIELVYPGVTMHRKLTEI